MVSITKTSDNNCDIPMADTNLELLFNDITNFPELYSAELIEDWTIVKPEMLNILQYYRAIKITDYQYGLNKFRHQNSRIIIFEFDHDKRKVREYNKIKEEWTSCECQFLNKKMSSTKLSHTRLLIKYGILFVKLGHPCNPRQFSIVMAVQESLKNPNAVYYNYYQLRKKLRKRNKNLNKSANATENSIALNSRSSELNDDDDCTILDDDVTTSITETSSFESEQLIEGKASNSESISSANPFEIFTTIEDTQVSTIPRLNEENAAYAEIDACIVLDHDVKPAILKRPPRESTQPLVSTDVSNRKKSNPVSSSNASANTTPTKSSIPTTSLPRLIVKEENNDNEDDCIILDDDDDIKPPSSKKPRLENHQPRYFTLEKPSTLLLKKACTKSDIPYSNEAYKLWSKIVIDKINILPSSSASATVHLHSFKSKNIFELFSMLLTGSSDKYYQIQYCINEAFRSKMINSGKMTLQEFDKIIMSTKITNEHLAFICKFLPCRIVIFEENFQKRFGKWNQNQNEEILTFVFSYFNELYSIVLNV